MKHFVYVIRSLKDNRLYKGMTTNLPLRIIEHNAGKNKSTKAYVPWELVYKKEFTERLLARKWELYLKTGRGRDFIKSYLKKNKPI